MGSFLKRGLRVQFATRGCIDMGIRTVALEIMALREGGGSVGGNAVETGRRVGGLYVEMLLRRGEGLGPCRWKF